jgi:hypothetical protein
MMEPSKTKTVLITGDLLQQVNLAGEHVSAHQALPALKVDCSPRRAWNFASLIEAACDDPLPQIVTTALAGKLHVLWGLCPREIEKKQKERDEPAGSSVWRICRPLGVADAEAAVQPSEDSDPPAPDLLLIDDLGVGFGDDPARWPSALREGGDPVSIIWKCDALRELSALWQHMWITCPRLGSSASLAQPQFSRRYRACIPFLTTLSPLRSPRGVTVPQPLKR